MLFKYHNRLPFTFGCILFKVEKKNGVVFDSNNYDHNKHFRDGHMARRYSSHSRDVQGFLWEGGRGFYRLSILFLSLTLENNDFE